ncbi:uncharacterized protein LACBIDRAFT_313887 [Laccaria bicolor S238N-H82]|uniref:Predicted protein n=1 Tax=Laccaria bicolor (strain S238N-H82 / ATCC MYA-4686) TaxID=486041 RepID=B0D125_LACBS|nr:uncharacterized protein LACBIDRAFT_313887 [Laccaria bicolor S238N-H82]EDR11558.1 predicted protein [Laccaria bicolor S238N-H82]|eukprot:XP_001877455.1 predicted protein [Laccaria bicolor S238N-H82]
MEVFETLRDISGTSYQEETFVGQGETSALMLILNQVDAQAVLPSSLELAFTLPMPQADPILSLSSVISTYMHRARHTYSSLYSHLGQLEDIDVLSSFFDSTEDSAFAAVELTKLQELRETHGSSSDEYTHLVNDVRSFLERVVDAAELNLAILTFDSSSSSSFERRQAQPLQSQSPFPNPPAQQPIGSVSTCFTTLDICNNSTTSCSGRGQCVEASKAGRTCFICTCGVTKTGKGSKVKTERWAGQSCERKDVSGPFVLLTGTVIAMILLVVGSVTLLYSVGDQALPSILLATSVSVKKD